MCEVVQEATGHSVTLAWADQGYTGEEVWQQASEHGIDLQIVKLTEAKKGFVLLPRRWVVERSFGWLARFRRLSRDYERLPTVLAGLHFLIFVTYQPDLSVEPLFTDCFAPVAHPRLGVRTVQDMARWPLIHFAWRQVKPETPSWERWFTEAGLTTPTPSAELRFSDEGHAIQAAIAGQGIALLSQALVADELASGHLQQAFGPTIAGHTYHLAVNAARDLSPSAQAVMAWLRDQAA